MDPKRMRKTRGFNPQVFKDSQKLPNVLRPQTLPNSMSNKKGGASFSDLEAPLSNKFRGEMPSSIPQQDRRMRKTRGFNPQVFKDSQKLPNVLRPQTLPNSMSNKGALGRDSFRDIINKKEANPRAPEGNENPFGYMAAGNNNSKRKKQAKRAAKIASAAAGVLLTVSIPFLSSSSLPFALLGNSYGKSVLNGLAQYQHDYTSVRLFGKSPKSTVKPTESLDKIAGLTDDEVKQLKKNGVEFQGGKKISGSNKTTFDAVRIANGSWVKADGIEAAMKNGAFRKAMTFQKTSLWKAAKSSAGVAVRNIFKYNPNPDLEAENPDETKKKLISESLEPGSANIGAPDPNSKDATSQEQKDRAKAQQLAGELNTDIANEAAAVQDGTADYATLARETEGGNLADALGRDSVDITDATKGFAGKAWGFLNILDVPDTICTVYQTAYTANMLARGLILFNVVRFGVTMAATIERAQAGEDDGNAMNNLMQLLYQKDPSSGQSFTASSYSAFLFNGEFSSQPSSVSAFGGSTMVALLAGMHALHTTVGLGDAKTGRTIIKNGCGIVQNLAVQIAATAGAAIISIPLGGAPFGIAAGVKTAVQESTKAAFTFVKKGIEAGLKKQITNLTEQGLKAYLAGGVKNGIKSLAKVSWKFFKGMSAMDKISLLVAGVSAFGMDYIVHGLAGGDIAGFASNGLSMIDAYGTARQTVDYRNGLGSGGAVGTYSQVSAYAPTRTQFEQEYIADMREEAKNTPFDLKNPYSTAGTLALAIQNTIGLDSGRDIPTAITSIASLPLRIGEMSQNVSAATSLTPEAIGEHIGNEYFNENKIGLEITGVPALVFTKSHTFDEIVANLVDGANPQIAYSGNDEKTNEPKLSIIPGTPLATFKDTCQNEARSEVDPAFAADDGSNFYDMDTCNPEGKNWKSEYSLYRDALAFVSQVTPTPDPAASGTTSSAQTATGTCPSGATVVPGITKGWAWKTGDESTITLCTVPGTEMSVVPHWTDSRYEGTSAKNIKQVAMNSEAIPSLLQIVDAAKKDGVTISASIGYRSLYEQCSIYIKNHDRPSECPSWITKVPGDWSTTTLYSNHMMGLSIDSTGAAESWLHACVEDNISKYKNATDGKKDNRCFGFWDDVNQTQSWDSAHFTYDPPSVTSTIKPV